MYVMTIQTKSFTKYNLKNMLNDLIYSAFELVMVFLAN